MNTSVCTVVISPTLHRYLLELDCEGDPAWDCLSNMHHWMLRLLFNSKEEFQGTRAGKPQSGECAAGSTLE